MAKSNTLCTAFEGGQCIASGELKDVALLAKIAVDRAEANAEPNPVLVFDDATSEVIELDWRGSPFEFAARIALQDQAATPASNSPRGPGRPWLGVVAREVTLLPRHWDWLTSQTGGASVALRKLVEAASRSSVEQDRLRQGSTAGYKFMSTIAGHQPGFEEASRALFAGDKEAFETQIAAWPMDVQTHLKRVLEHAAYWGRTIGSELMRDEATVVT